MIKGADERVAMDADEAVAHRMIKGADERVAMDADEAVAHRMIKGADERVFSEADEAVAHAADSIVIAFRVVYNPDDEAYNVE
jgi:hypothetical protein